MFIELLDPKNLFAPAERNALCDLFLNKYIALRWSAKRLVVKFYKHLAPLEPTHGRLTGGILAGALGTLILTPLVIADILRSVK